MPGSCFPGSWEWAEAILRVILHRAVAARRATAHLVARMADKIELHIRGLDGTCREEGVVCVCLRVCVLEDGERGMESLRRIDA